jgi:hypothetical protein
MNSSGFSNLGQRAKDPPISWLMKMSLDHPDLVSYFQNPSGTTTSFAKKTAILELLRHYERSAGHPLYLLEDAAYRDLRFTGEDVPSRSQIFQSALNHKVLYVLWRSAKLSRVCSDKLSQRLEAEGAASSFQGVD